MSRFMSQSSRQRRFESLASDLHGILNPGEVFPNNPYIAGVCWHLLEDTPGEETSPLRLHIPLT